MTSKSEHASLSAMLQLDLAMSTIVGTNEYATTTTAIPGNSPRM